MTELYNLCQSRRKVWRSLPNGGHNDSVAEPGYFEYIHSFIMEEVLDDVPQTRPLQIDRPQDG